MQWTPEQRAEALELLAEVGKAEAARRTGIPAGTIASWGVRAGVAAPGADVTRPAVEARLATVAERKAKLAEALLGDIEKLRRQLWAPTVERKPMVVSDGRDMGSHIEIAEVHLEQPTFKDQKTIVEAVAIALDKVQLLTGAATERIETTSVPRTPEVAAELAKVITLARPA
jgi:transposase-like protein